MLTLGRAGLRRVVSPFSSKNMMAKMTKDTFTDLEPSWSRRLVSPLSKDMMAKMTEAACTDLGVSFLRGLDSVSPFCSKDMMAKMTMHELTLG